MAITDPRDISGLVAWYSADAEAAHYSDGNNLTVLHDQSGAGNNTTLSGSVGSGVQPQWRSSGGPGGSAKTFEFNGGHYHILPNVLTGATGATVAGHIKVSTTGSFYAHWSFGSPTGSGASSAYTFSGQVLDNLGRVATTGSRISIPSPGVTVTNWQRYHAHATSGDQKAYFNNSVAATHTNTGFGFDTAPVIAASRDGASISTAFDGFMSCIVVYNRVLTTGERADLDTWLAANPGGGVPTSGSTLTHVANVPGVTSNFALSNPLALTHNANVPGVTSSFSLDVVASSSTITHVANVPGVTSNFAVFVPEVTYAEAVLADDPVAYYRFSESSGTTMNDSSGNSHHGTYTSATVLNGEGLADQTDTSIDLPGATNHASAANASWLHNIKTIEAWIRADSLTGTRAIAWTPLFSLYTGFDGILSTDISTSTGATGFSASTYGELNAATIYHVVATFDGTNVKMYINGALEQTDAKGGTFGTHSAPLRIGADGSPTVAHFFDGEIDEVALYDYALDATRIAAHYDALQEVALQEITHVANVPGVTSSFTLVTNVIVSHVANVPGVTSDFTIEGALASGLITHTANVPGVTSSFSLTVSGFYSEGETDNAADGIIIDGTATWQWTPAVTPLPGGFYPRAHGNYDVAQAFSAVTINGAHPSYEATYERQAALRPRVVMAGQDVSFLRGYETVIGGWQLVEPFLYSTADLVFPQIVAPFEKPGEGALAFLAKGTRMSIEMVDDESGEVVSTVYKGVVSAWNPQGRDLRVECLGEVRGPASTRYKPLPLIPWRHDAGRLIVRMLNNLGVTARPQFGVETGYVLGEPGGTWMLEALEEMHAQAWTLSGDQWSTMPDEDGVYRTALKDRTTPHMTAYPDDTRVVVDLRSDQTEEPNRIFGTGTTPKGMRINNGVYPGMIEVKDVPDFPGDMSSGDSGDDVVELIHRLRITRYMNADESAGGFDSDVVDAVKDLQEDAGLSQTGIVNEATWRALWDLDVTGASPRGAQIVPMAQRDYTREWFHAGGGGFTGLNPDFDPSRQMVDMPIDFGAKQKRRQMVRRSRALLADVEEQWVGSVQITTGAVIEGDHTPGDPITSIMRAHDIRPGMNIKLPSMLGDRLLHISGVNVSGRNVTLAVDTKARDAVPVWQIHERNRESRKDPNRAWLREYRSSGQVRDTLGEFSEVGGINDRRRPLVPNEWIVFEVLSGPIEGTIRSIRLNCGSGVEFAVAVFGSKMNAARMNNLVPNPLSADGYDRWKDPDIRQHLKDRVLLYAAGIEEDPCGYWPDKKSEGASIITGKWEHDAQFPYRTMPVFDQASFVDGDQPLNQFPEPVLYVAVYANANGYVRPGRVMWPQAESGV